MYIPACTHGYFLGRAGGGAGVGGGGYWSVFFGRKGTWLY